MVGEGVPYGVVDVTHEPRWLSDSLLRLMVGDVLGEGCYRRVYALRGDERHVVKVEFANSARFHNAMEWEIWKEVQGTEWERWFCPLVRIDTFGKTMVARRTKELTDRQWAKFVEHPAFLQDIKRDNFGWLDGRVVCVDYANNSILARGFRGPRMVKREDHPC